MWMTAFFNWLDFQSTHFSEMSSLENKDSSMEFAVDVSFGLDSFLCCVWHHCHPCLCPPSTLVDHVTLFPQSENKHDVQLMILSTVSTLFLAHCTCCVAQLQTNQTAEICLVHQVLLLKPKVCVLSYKPSGGHEACDKLGGRLWPLFAFKCQNARSESLHSWEVTEKQSWAIVLSISTASSPAHRAQIILS